jgi:hypothetical protein
MGFTPDQASKLLQEARAQRAEADARNRLKAEQARNVAEARRRAEEEERARLEQGFAKQAQATLRAAMDGRSSLIVPTEIFGRTELLRGGFLLFARCPVDDSDRKTMAEELARLKGELEKPRKAVDVAKEAWVSGILCQSQLLEENDHLSQEITDIIGEGVDAFINMKLGEIDFYERADGYDCLAEDGIPDLLWFFDARLATLIPDDVEWSNLNPEIPRLRRAIDALVAFDTAAIQCKVDRINDALSHGKQVDICEYRAGHSLEIHWGHLPELNEWKTIRLNDAAAHRWISGPPGRNLIGYIYAAIRSAIQRDLAQDIELIFSRMIDNDWGIEQLQYIDFDLQQGDDPDALIPSPPPAILAELLELEGWETDIDASDQHHFKLQISWQGQS